MTFLDVKRIAVSTTIQPVHCQRFENNQKHAWLLNPLRLCSRRDGSLAAPSAVSGPQRKGRQPHQLPAGRHGLTRSYVLSNQRDRIVESVIEVVSETGYAGLTVRAVVERAGVSRRTFYEHFSNKEDVFLAVYDVVVERLAGDVRLAYASGRTYPQQVAFGLETFLGRLAFYPALAHVCIVQVLAAGPDALARRARALQTFCDLIRPAGEARGGSRRSRSRSRSAGSTRSSARTSAAARRTCSRACARSCSRSC